MLVRLVHVSKGSWQPQLRTSTGSINGEVSEPSRPWADVTSFRDRIGDAPGPVAILDSAREHGGSGVQIEQMASEVRSDGRGRKHALVVF